MNIALDSAQNDLLVGLLAAMAASCSVIVVAWPYVFRNTLDSRMERISSEREQIRRRERDRAAAAEPARRKRGSWFVRFMGRLGLNESAADEGVALKMQMAGYRGRGATVWYLAARSLMPVVMFTFTFLYAYSVFKVEQVSTGLLVAVVAGGLGFYLPGIYLKNRILKRQQSIQRAWPDALDLMLICVESGMTIEPAMQKVSSEIGSQSVELAEELGLTTAELSFIPDRRQAYDNLGKRTGLDCVKSVVASLKQAEKQGTAIGRSLRVLAQENRDMRMNLAEQKAAALPPMLTVPMIIFFLPVLFVVIMTPAILQIMSL